jgi:hypothetical protein
MTVADWESPHTQIVHYEAALAGGGLFRLTIDRIGRRVATAVERG